MVEPGNLDVRIYYPQKGDVVHAQRVSELIGLHHTVMVPRTPEQVDEWAGGRSVAVQVRDRRGGEWETAAYSAITHLYEEQGRSIGEAGAVVSDPKFNGIRKHLTALAILKLFDLDITGKMDEVIALVLQDNIGSTKLFDNLEGILTEDRFGLAEGQVLQSRRIGADEIPAAASDESVCNDGQPDIYSSFALRRVYRNAMLTVGN